MKRTTVHPGGREPRAFTLVELVVVLVLVAIFAGAIVPRIMATDSRRAAQEAKEVAALISVAARREALSTEAVGLHHDFDRGMLVLLVQRRFGEGTEASSSAWVDQTVYWREDPLLQPVALRVLEVVESNFGGQPSAAKTFTIEFPRNQPRPDMSLLLTPREGEGGSSYQVDLQGSWKAAKVTRRDNPARLLPLNSEVVDLDVVNGGRDAW